MTEISDLIEFENENSNLDFKLIQYKKEQYTSLLKDVMAMANSLSTGEKYIIIGVKPKASGQKDFVGITEDLIDEATYQQLIDANIEPQINFSYFPCQFQGKLFAVFQIRNCVDRPYMMKKDFEHLKTGDSYIRKGSFQKRLTRKDIDNQLELQMKNDISGDIKVSLKEDEIIHQLVLKKNEVALPSEINRKKIEEIIKRKEKELRDNPNPFKLDFSPLFSSSYEVRSLDTLKSDLENVAKTYFEHDQYAIDEEFAHKLNFYIHNNSNVFLEDSAIEIIIPKNDNYIVRDSICPKPTSTHPLSITISHHQTLSWDEMNYPTVEEKNDYYKIYEEIGNVKHKLPTEALKVPIRIVNKGTNTINIRIKVFAKNITNPIQQNLEITF